jgi:predicted transcriptional regulator
VIGPDAGDDEIRDDADEQLDALLSAETDATRPHDAEVTDESDARDGRESGPQRDGFVAMCRHCRSHHKTAEAARAHADSCAQRPVATCRFCHEPHTIASGANPGDHYYDCQPFRAWYKRQQRQRTAPTGERGVEGDLDPFAQRRVVQPWWHEFAAYVKYDTSERKKPYNWYYALDSARKEHDGELLTGFEVAADELPAATRRVAEQQADDDLDAREVVEQWSVALRYSDSNIHPPDDHVARDLDWRLDTVKEPRVYVFPSSYDSFKEAKSEGRARAYFRLRPRWPDQEADNRAGDTVSINPTDLVGTDVAVKGTNIEFSRYPDLLQRAIAAIKAQQGVTWNAPTYVDPSSFDREHIHSSSNITDAELYVRVEDGKTGQLIAIDGPIHRVSMLLAGDREGYAKSVRDDRERAGSYHTATIGSMRAGHLVGGHNLAKEIKHYYGKNPDAATDALQHPKVGVSLQHSVMSDTVYWEDLDSLERELDETLLNVLQWADIPLRPAEGPYVADDYFEPVGASRFRKLVDDPTPRIESEQENAVERWAFMSNLNETHTDTLRKLVTDGGELSPADIADEIGKHVSTVRKALRQLGDMVKRRYGDVQLRSQYLAQQVVKRLDAVDAVVEHDLEGAADNLVRAENVAATPGEGSAWLRWRDNWVEDVRKDGEKDEIVLGWECADRSELRRLIRGGAIAFRNDQGGDSLGLFSRTFRVRGRLRNGEEVTYADGTLLDLLPTGWEYFNPG